MSNYCKVCNKLLVKSNTGYCSPCWNHTRSGINHPRYISKDEIRCIDCNKILKHKKATRCKSCYAKYRTKLNGGFFLGHKHSKQTKKLISLSTIKLRTGTHHTEISKQLISKKAKIRMSIKENVPFFGKHHTVETKKQLSLSHGGNGIPYSNSEYGAEFDDILKEKVRFRDGYKCQNCGCSQLENGRQLDTHHIDYNKKNNILINLLSLCRKCHTKTNTSNKPYWVIYYKTKMEGNLGK